MGFLPGIPVFEVTGTLGRAEFSTGFPQRVSELESYGFVGAGARKIVRAPRESNAKKRGCALLSDDRGITCFFSV